MVSLQILNRQRQSNSLPSIRLSVLPNAVAMGSGFGIYKTICSPNYLNLTYGIYSHSRRGTIWNFVWIRPWSLPLSKNWIDTSIRSRVVRGAMENQRNLQYLNEKTRENIKNFFQNGVSISVIARSFGVHRTTVWRVIKGKTEYWTKRDGRKRKTSKLEGDFITITIKKNYDRPITTIKKGNFPQHSRWLIRNRMSESGFRLHSPTITPTLTANQKKERYQFALEVIGRPLSYWRSVFFADETLITDTFFNPNQKVICGVRFPMSALTPVRRGAHPSKKLCWFALRHGEPVRWRVIEGTMNSSTFVSTILEVFTKELRRNYTGQVIVVQNNAPCHVSKMVSIFLLIACTYDFFYYLDHAWT